jgi:hypothetical protein
MKATLKKNKATKGNWSQWIGSAALALALGGLFVPATTYAAVNNSGEMVDEEVIEIEGTAPWNPPNWGGHSGGGAPNGTPSGDGGGGSGGGGVVPSGGGASTSDTSKTAAARIAEAKELCEDYLTGTWDKNVIFHDKGIKTNKQLVGYRCTYRVQGPAGLVYTYIFYDSRGSQNYACNASANSSDCPDGHTF